MVIKYQKMRSGEGVLSSNGKTNVFHKGKIIASSDSPQGVSLEEQLSLFYVPKMFTELKWVCGPLIKAKVELEWLFNDDKMWTGRLWDTVTPSDNSIVTVNLRSHELFNRTDFPYFVPKKDENTGYEIEIDSRVTRNNLQLERSLALHIINNLHKNHNPKPGRTLIEFDNVFSAKWLGWEMNAPLISGRGTILKLQLDKFGDNKKPIIQRKRKLLPPKQ